MSDEPSTHASEVTKPGAGATACPMCQTARPAGDRFCETCGHDFEAVVAAEPAWELVIEADPAFHARFAGDIAFPRDVAPQRMTAEAAELRIGRVDARSNGAAADPGLSRRHAVLRRLGNGAYAIEDLGSTNGTEVNGQQIAAGEPVTLADGDRVHLGAWSTLTLRAH